MNKIFNKIKNLIKVNNLDQYLTKKYFDYAIIVFAILLGFYLKWDMENIFLFAFIIWLILNPVQSSVLAKVALVFLSFTPLLLIIKREAQAEKVAILAYYFLVLTVIFAIIEFKSEKLLKLSRKKK